MLNTNQLCSGYIPVVRANIQSMLQKGSYQSLVPVDA